MSGRKRGSNELKQQSRADGVGVGRVNVILNKLTFDLSLSRGHICPLSSGPLINSPAGSPDSDTRPLNLQCCSPQISPEQLVAKMKLASLDVKLNGYKTSIQKSGLYNQTPTQRVMITEKCTLINRKAFGKFSAAPHRV